MNGGRGGNAFAALVLAMAAVGGCEAEGTGEAGGDMASIDAASADSGARDAEAPVPRDVAAPDAVVRDAAARDVAAGDASADDAAAFDANALDAAAPDAALLDAAVPDAADAPDAAALDAAAPDAHSPDASEADAGPPPSGVTVYDVGAEFSEVANPNGPWSLRSGDVVIPTFVADWGGIVGQGAWAFAASVPDLVPSFFRLVVPDAGFEQVEVGDFALHSQDEGAGAGLGPARIVWTSPGAGEIAIAGDIWLGRDIGRANTWTLTVGGALLASGAVFDGDQHDRTNPQSLTLGARGALSGIAVAAGDELVLEVAQAIESPFGEVTGVRLVVTLTE